MTPSEITFEAYQEEGGGYYASAVGFAIVTQGDDWDELKYMVEDATLVPLRRWRGAWNRPH